VRSRVGGLVDCGALAGKALENSSAVLCQTNGLGFWLQLSTHARMSAASFLVLRWAERYSFLVVSAENHRSTRFIHDP
jgi:hypothetical protein